jgi:hypothetical protein
MKMAVAAFAAALSLAAVTTSGAYANQGINLRAGLELTERGTPVPAGGAVYNENFVLDGECHEESVGKLLNNGAPIDVIALGALTWDKCEQGSLSGAIKYMALSDTGTALIYTDPTLTLTTPGPCVYEFSLLQGQFPVGEGTGAYITGEATGYRNPRANGASCARTIHTEFTVGEFGADEFLLNTEPTSSPRF